MLIQKRVPKFAVKYMDALAHNTHFQATKALKMWY